MKPISKRDRAANPCRFENWAAFADSCDKFPLRCRRTEGRATGVCVGMCPVELDFFPIFPSCPHCMHSVRMRGARIVGPCNQSYPGRPACERTIDGMCLVTLCDLCLGERSERLTFKDSLTFLRPKESVIYMTKKCPRSKRALA